jgi:iron complex outermembrane receptor protein
MNVNSHQRLSAAALTVSGLLLSAAAPVANAWQGPSIPVDRAESLFDLSLEELLNIQVTGAARKAQRLAETAAAAFVISADDIYRSGATSIAEALRMVPGMHVARIDGNSYAISARGSNDRYATKMLMMIDGRSVYTPTYSGIYWDTQDIPVTEIERIEVVRGPGSALWGINAVNGVINVITRDAADAAGGLAVASAGNKINHDVSVRWGDRLSPHADYRVYGQFEDRDGNRDLQGDSTNDTANTFRFGTRLDLALSDIDTLMISAEAYSVESGITLAALNLQPPFDRTRLDDERDTDGLHLLGRWSRLAGDDSETVALAYFDYMDRKDPGFGEEKYTYEFDIQHRSQAFDGHDLIGGATLRYHDIELDGSDERSFDKTDHDNLMVSAFLQDDIEILADQLTLTLGAKLEYNDNSDEDIEFMPTARLIWSVNERNHLWGAITRAVRAPNLGEQYAKTSLPLQEHFPDLVLGELSVPIFLTLEGDGMMKSEDLVAYELGFRSQVSSSLHLDMALFYQDYQNLRWPKFKTFYCQPANQPAPDCFSDPNLPPLEYLALFTEMANASDGDASGVELAMNWQVQDDWQLLSAYSYLDYHVDPDNLGGGRSGTDVKHNFSLQSRHDLGENAALDVWLRYTDKVEAYKIDDYWGLDIRLAWKLSDRLEISLHGKDLLESGHEEFESELREQVPVEIERSYRAEIRYEF